MINEGGLEWEVRAGGVSGRGWLSGLQSHKTRIVLTYPLFTEWSVQPRGSWLENNKCCYWWLGSKQDIANACPSLSNYCSLWVPDSDKPIATPYFHRSVHLALLISVLLNWERKNTGNKYENMLMNDKQHTECLSSLYWFWIVGSNMDSKPHLLCSGLLVRDKGWLSWNSPIPSLPKRFCLYFLRPESGFLATVIRPYTCVGQCIWRKTLWILKVVGFRSL